MSKRYARNHDPILPKVHRVELSEGNTALRLLAVGVAIAIAVAAFGYAINTLLTPQTGWREIEAGSSETGCATQFIFQYEIGSGEKGPTAEYRELSLLYTQAMDEAYKALDSREEAANNLATLNAHPNTKVVLDPIAYAALQCLKTEGSRAAFYAPVYDLYNSLYNCQSDEEAEKFDPRKSAEMDEYVRELAAFAADPSAVFVELYPDDTAELAVSQEYLEYAAANEITGFVDLGWLKNAFILDYTADRLMAAGFTHGTISSFDGFTRTLGEGDYTQNLFEQPEGKLRQTGVARYTAAAALVSFRGFPQLAKDESNFYTYADGTVVGPYISADGFAKAAAPNLLVLSTEGSCAALAVRTLPAFASDSLGEIPGSWARTENGKCLSSGNELVLSEPTAP